MKLLHGCEMNKNYPISTVPNILTASFSNSTISIGNYVTRIVEPTGTRMKMITSAAAEIAVIAPVWIVTTTGQTAYYEKIEDPGSQLTSHNPTDLIICTLESRPSFVLNHDHQPSPRLKNSTRSYQRPY